MSFKGDLESFDITMVFQLLSSNQKTGVLRVSSGSNEVRVYMMEGRLFLQPVLI